MPRCLQVAKSTKEFFCASDCLDGCVLRRSIYIYIRSGIFSLSALVRAIKTLLLGDHVTLRAPNIVPSSLPPDCPLPNSVAEKISIFLAFLFLFCLWICHLQEYYNPTPSLRKARNRFCIRKLKNLVNKCCFQILVSFREHIVSSVWDFLVQNTLVADDVKIDSWMWKSLSGHVVAMSKPSKTLFFLLNLRMRAVSTGIKFCKVCGQHYSYCQPSMSALNSQISFTNVCLVLKANKSQLPYYTLSRHKQKKWEREKSNKLKTTSSGLDEILFLWVEFVSRISLSHMHIIDIDNKHICSLHAYYGFRLVQTCDGLGFFFFLEKMETALWTGM